MNDDEIWTAIDGRRLAVCELLTGLTEDEWRVPSLCTGWTVRDVAAHLTLQQLTLREALGLVLRSPGGIGRVTREAARRRAAWPTDALVEGIRSTVGTRKHNVGVTPRETLVDFTVHALDIAVPLGRTLPVDPVAAIGAADRIWQLRWPFHARRRFEGRRLEATDVDWAAGEGAPVRAPIDGLLLLMTGRPTSISAAAGSPGRAAASPTSDENAGTPTDPGAGASG